MRKQLPNPYLIFEKASFTGKYLNGSLSSIYPKNKTDSYESKGVDNLCSCLEHLEATCYIERQNSTYYQPNHLSYDSELGRMLYTTSILLMFSSVIFLLMVRSIRRSHSTVEMESLLDAMRFREELDNRQRQRFRLQKAKNKVSAWLYKNNTEKIWQNPPPPSQERTNSIHSSGSYIPEIVISNNDSEERVRTMVRIPRQNSFTPSLSLLYDFSMSSGRNSILTDSFETVIDDITETTPGLSEFGQSTSSFETTRSNGLEGRSASVCRVLSFKKPKKPFC